MSLDLLPSIEEGNYSMVLFDKNVGEVNDWIRQDMRTEASAINSIRTDLHKFHEFDDFSFTDITPIRLESECDRFVDKNFSNTLQPTFVKQFQESQQKELNEQQYDLENLYHR